MKETEPNPAGATPGPEIDIGLVEALADIVTRLGLSEIELKQGDIAIRVARQVAAASLAPVAAPVPVPAGPPGGKAQGVAAKSDAPGTVKSPMVGTAYLRASPDAPPFVELGSSVRGGAKLMLVEAMKTFNEIVAPRAGTVTAILVEDGQPVEYGQPLLVIE
jgi:acetyl-CoA carboxylase biotin carboxyl carrier protein